MRTSHLPLRLATGAFILHAGLSHWGADEETAKGTHGMAAGAYPALGRFEPPDFLRFLSASETALGAALLTPVVPASLAGVGLGVFSGALLGMYAKTAALHRPGSLRPNQDGTALAKDTWMAGIAASLLIDAVADRFSRRRS